MAEFKFEVDKNFGDHVIEERDNLSIIMRKISWGNSSEYKVDIRKYLYTEEGERMNKGISLTDNGKEVIKEIRKNNSKRLKRILKVYNLILNRVNQVSTEQLYKSLNIKL